jgi:hypothetical protein
MKQAHANKQAHQTSSAIDPLAALSNARDSVGAAAHAIHEEFGDITDKVGKAGAKAYQGAKETVMHGVDTAEEATQAVRKEVATKPLTYLALGIGAGFLVGHIWRVMHQK